MKAISLLLLMAACAHENDQLTAEARLNRHLRQCYVESDSFRKKEGIMKHEMHVHGDGTVKSVKIVESDFKTDRNFEACISGVLKKSIVTPPVKGQEFVLVQPVKFMERQE